jgi:phage terminase small subunit
MGIDGEDELNPRHRRFVEEYLRDPRPKAAAIRAGYSEKSAAKTAWWLLHQPRVAAAIRAAQRNRSERLRVTTDRVVREHARIALADMGRLVRLTRKGPRLRRPREISADDSAAVREVIRSKDGFHIKLYDKTKSLHTLTAMLGLVDRLEADGAAVEERAATKKWRAKFHALVDTMRERLKVDPGVSRYEAVAEGVARGDAEAVTLAEKAGYMKKSGA